ncbi:MAG: hypothetical protein M3Z26_13185 [Bacteroidota bacterium]|nr:hypothetical protein [Bacteroidota bacterium]
MNQNDWINTLIIIITIVPLIKMARAKRFSGYNIFIVLIGIAILSIGINKNHKDASINIEKEKLAHASDSTNKSDIKKLGKQMYIVTDSLKNIRTKLDSIGLGIDKTTGKLKIFDYKDLEKFISIIKPQTNVTSIGQKGGQTARDITNNNK